MAITQGLCEICSPKQWKTISAEMLTVSGYPVYGANGIIGYYSKYNHEEPTLLITCRGATCGAINICKPYSYVNGNAMALDNLTVDVDIKYLYYYLLNRGFEDVITGSAQPQIVRQSLQKVRVTYPNKEKQIEIVTVLDNVTDLISLRKEQLAKLDQLVKSRFIEMFGDPVQNSMNWDTEKMNDVAPAVDYSGDFEEPVWLLNLDMVESQTGRIIDYLYVSKEEVGSSTCTFDSSNVLYSKLRPYLNKVVVPNKCGYATSEMLPLKPVPTKLERIYFASMLRSDEFVNMINTKVAGAKMPRVSMSVFREFNVPIPPLDLQNQFAAFVEQVDKSKFELKQSLEKLEMLKKSLMQQYFG